MKVDLIVPTTLHDIPLHQYQKFVKTFEDLQDPDALTDEYAGIKMLEIFCGLKTTEAMSVKIADMNNVVDRLNKALSEKPSLIQRFKLGKTDFGFIPKLDDLTFGEYIDIENNITDWSKMHAAMAVLYRPIVNTHKDKYEIEEYKGDTWHEAIKNMPASVAVSALLFFYSLESELLKATKDFGNNKQINHNLTLNQILTENGVGTQASIN